MGCASSKFVPWAGRNEITLAAKERKKAAKELLAAYRACSGCHSSYLDTLKLTGQSLAVFLDEEDRAMLAGPLPNPSVGDPAANQEPSSYQASWSKTPATFEDTPGVEEVAGEGAAGKGKGEEQLGMPGEDAPSMPPASLPPPPAPAGLSPPEQEGGDSGLQAAPPPGSAAAVVAVSYGGETVWQPASGYCADQIGPRGAGLAQLGQALSGLFGEVEQAARPVTDLLVCGMAKNYSALPPLPAQAQAQAHGQGQGYAGAPQESLWDVLEILLAYEKFRCREIKLMEAAKWDHARNSGRLAKQARKQVAEAKVEQQQKRINAAHAKVQAGQGTIARLAQSVEAASQAIDAIKTNLLRPAVLQFLPALLETGVHVSQIHERQRQLVVEAFANGALSNRHLAGPAVLLTQKNHQMDTEALKAVLTKLDLAFSANIASQKKVLTSLLAWLRRVDPTNAAAALRPAGPPQPSFGPSQGHGQPPLAPLPAHSSEQPHVTLPPEPGQIIPYQNAALMGGPQMVGQFLDGSVSGGDPLSALCSDWLRATEKLAEQPVHDAVHAYTTWVKEALSKQAAEGKQAKKLEDTRKQMGKAEAKYEGLLHKEKAFRSTLARPNEGPMSRSLSQAHGPPAPGALQLSMAPHAAAPTEGPTAPATEPLPSDANSGAIQPWQPPQQLPLPPMGDEAVDKAGAKALAKEQAKEVKAFQLAKEVDLAKGVLEGLKVKVREEQAALEAMALDARITALRGVEASLPGLFQGLAAHCAVASQMYGMLQFQHAQGWAPAR